jgi:DNA-binding NarL/FixJ family response regulator
VTRKIQVLAVEHNRILSEGIRVLIGLEHDLELSGSTSDADEAVRIFSEQRPDLTLMDLDLPSSGGVEAIRHIRGMDPAAWIIGLITDEWDERSRQAVEAGASAVLAKDLIGKMLVPLILGSWANARSKPLQSEADCEPSAALKPGA